jgi:hypothetical protein
MLGVLRDLLNIHCSAPEIEYEACQAENCNQQQDGDESDCAIDLARIHVVLHGSASRSFEKAAPITEITALTDSPTQNYKQKNEESRAHGAENPSKHGSVPQHVTNCGDGSKGVESRASRHSHDPARSFEPGRAAPIV